MNKTTPQTTFQSQVKMLCSSTTSHARHIKHTAAHMQATPTTKLSAQKVNIAAHIQVIFQYVKKKIKDSPAHASIDTINTNGSQCLTSRHAGLYDGPLQ